MGTLSGNARPSSNRHAGRGARVVACFAILACLPLATSLAVVALSPAETARIGKRVWQNECGGTVAGLTSWNAGENFASLGIGHFIWYPAGARGPFEESFPAFVRYASAHHAKLPALLSGNENTPCPWRSRSEFGRAAHSKEMESLRQFLAGSLDLQAAFLVLRLQEALPKMTAAAAGNRDGIAQQFERVTRTSQGCYALVDYVNFKGEGVLPTERYAGVGWGLLQVLEGMAGTGEGPDAARDFSESAKAVLRRRVKNSPPERGESRWLAGWLSRVATYAK